MKPNKPKVEQPSLDDIHVNALLIVESLGERDKVKTGQVLCEYLSSLRADANVPVQIIFERVTGVEEFRSLLQGLPHSIAVGGLYPVLHVEAHGSEEGIFFADDTMMSWNEFCILLTPINRALDLRLMVVVAACFGIGLVNGIKLNQAAPCFSMVGPTDEIDPGEVMGRFRLMYRELLLTLSAGPSYAALRRDPLETGGMVMMTAISWFQWLMEGYLRNHVNRAAMKALALKQHLAQKELDRSLGMSRYKTLYKARLPGLIRSYFEAFFMYEELESSRARFAPVWNKIDPQITTALERL